MALQCFYPVLMAEDVEASTRFYAERMGFEKTFEGDRYVSLRHRENPAYELAVLSLAHEILPDGFRGTPASGMLIKLEVSDARTEYECLKEAGLRIMLPLRDETFGQSHFIGVGPGALYVT